MMMRVHFILLPANAEEKVGGEGAIFLIIIQTLDMLVAMMVPQTIITLQKAQG